MNHMHVNMNFLLRVSCFSCCVEVPRVTERLILEVSGVCVWSITLKLHVCSKLMNVYVHLCVSKREKVAAAASINWPVNPSCRSLQQDSLKPAHRAPNYLLAPGDVTQSEGFFSEGRCAAHFRLSEMFRRILLLRKELLTRLGTRKKDEVSWI